MKRRIAWTIAVALWATLVACYWRVYVPLRPLTSIAFANNVEPLGWTADGDVVVVPTLNWSDIVSNEPFFGPVQVWRFPEGRLVRELFTPEDRIQFDDFGRTGEVTAVRDSTWSLFNASTGEMVERIPVSGMVNSYVRVSDANQIIFSEANRVRCYDTARDTLLWSVDGFRNVTSLGPDFVVVGKAILEPHGWVSGSPASALRLTDGQPLSRFDHLGAISWLVPSRDGRFAAVRPTRQKAFTMCDAKTGEVRWTGQYSGVPNGYGFEDDGRTFRISSGERNGDHLKLRWNVEDGTPLNSEVVSRAGEPWRGRDQGSRMATESENPNVGIEAAVRRFVSKTPFARLLPPRTDRTWLVDAETSTKLGIIATGRRLILPTRDDKGVIVVAGTHVDYFELSPIRNWRWLAGWTVLPPTVIALLLRIGRRRRGKVVAA